MTPKLIDCVVTTMSIPEKGEKNNHLFHGEWIFFRIWCQIFCLYCDFEGGSVHFEGVAGVN